jgi:hypothetical protein
VNKDKVKSRLEDERTRLQRLRALTLAPENGVLVCDCACATPANAIVASATSAARNNWDFIPGILLFGKAAAA